MDFPGLKGQYSCRPKAVNQLYPDFWGLESSQNKMDTSGVKL